MERILERPQDSVVIVGTARNGSEGVVDVKIRNRRFQKNKSFCSPPRIISILCIVIMVQVQSSSCLLHHQLEKVVLVRSEPLSSS